jgi:hypothetical protein
MIPKDACAEASYNSSCRDATAERESCPCCGAPLPDRLPGLVRDKPISASRNHPNNQSSTDQFGSRGTKRPRTAPLVHVDVKNQPKVFTNLAYYLHQTCLLEDERIVTK